MRSRIGLKALGLCALVVGMMALSAGAAQASEWFVGGAKITETLKPLTAGELVGATASLLTTVNKLGIQIECTVGTLVNVKLVHPETTTTGKVKFEGCKIFKTTGHELLKCTKVNSPGAANGTIETTEGKGLLEGHESKPVVLVLPNNVEKRFATIETAGCGLPELIPVFGELTLQDSKGEGEVELVKHEVNELKALSHVFVISDTEEHKAVLDGKALVFLVGGAPDEGLKFSGKP